MPKKIAGENTKAVAAKEKKSKAQEETRLKEQKESDDAKGPNDDKVFKNKLKRKEKKNEKKDELLRRKNELRELLKKESQSMCKTSSTSKPTREEIRETLTSTAKKSAKTHEQNTSCLTENMNRLTLGEEIARSIDAAIKLFEHEQTDDRHWEKRRKAAHQAYEEKRLKELKVSHPFLKLSQMKELIFKEWQKMGSKQ